jgi:arabinofuranosyltransferase
VRDRYFILLVIILIVLIELPFVEYITDDTFINLQFAKNLIAGRGLSFNPGEPTYGFSDPLFILLISAVGVTGAELLAVAKIVGLAALVLSGIFFYLLFLLFSADRYLSRAAALVWALNAWSVRWGLSGMDTSLMTAWVVVSLYFFHKDTESGLPRHSVWILALASLVRPEAIGLLAICFVAAILPQWRGRVLARLRSERRVGLSILSSGVAVSLVWCAYAFMQFGRITPNTVAVKAGRFISPEGIWNSITVVGKILGSTNGPELALIALALIVALATKRLPVSLRSFHLAAVGWLVALPALYILRDVQVVSRYLVPVIPLAVLYGFLSLRWIGGTLRLSTQSFRWVVSVVSFICIVLNVLLLALVAYPHTHSFSKDMRGSLVYLGKWFSQNTPAGTTIAIPDIGAFAYYSGREIVDLGGLVTPAMIPILREHELDEVLTRFLFARVARPDYVVDRARSPRRLLGVEGIREAVTPVVTTSVSNLGITRPGTFYYTAYSIDWDKLEPEWGGGKGRTDK